MEASLFFPVALRSWCCSSSGGEEGACFCVNLDDDDICTECGEVDYTLHFLYFSRTTSVLCKDLELNLSQSV